MGNARAGENTVFLRYSRAAASSLRKYHRKYLVYEYPEPTVLFPMKAHRPKVTLIAQPRDENRFELVLGEAEATRGHGQLVVDPGVDGIGRS